MVDRKMADLPTFRQTIGVAGGIREGVRGKSIGDRIRLLDRLVDVPHAATRSRINRTASRMISARFAGDMRDQTLKPRSAAFKASSRSHFLA
jgi:hypothetical protein